MKNKTLCIILICLFSLTNYAQKKNIKKNQNNTTNNLTAQNKSINKLVDFIENNASYVENEIQKTYPSNTLRESIINFINEKKQIEKDLKKGITYSRDALQTTMNILGTTESNTYLYMLWYEISKGEKADYVREKAIFVAERRIAELEKDRNSYSNHFKVGQRVCTDGVQNLLFGVKDYGTIVGEITWVSDNSYGVKVLYITDASGDYSTLVYNDDNNFTLYPGDNKTFTKKSLWNGCNK